MIWMSNDLDVEEQADNFHSSSEYRHLYKSLAVFLIKRPTLGEHDVQVINEVEGLLTFDACKSNVFVEKECRQIMGFVAHCVFEIFKEISHEKN